MLPALEHVFQRVEGFHILPRAAFLKCLFCQGIRNQDGKRQAPMQTDLAVKEPNCLSGGKTEFSEYTLGLLLGLRLHTRMDDG